MDYFYYFFLCDVLPENVSLPVFSLAKLMILRAFIVSQFCVVEFLMMLLLVLFIAI